MIAEPRGPRVLLFVREEVAAALTAALDAAGAEVVWSGADAGSAQAEQGARQTDVLVLDADLDLQAAVSLARSAVASAVVFLEPRDPIVGDLLVDLRPAGFLARDPSVAQVSAVLAGARCAPTHLEQACAVLGVRTRIQAVVRRASSACSNSCA